MDEVRVRSCLIFRYRIWPKNNVYWKSIVICYKNIIRVDYCWPSPINICHLMKQENIAIYLPVLQRFDSAVFQTLPNLDVHPGVAVYHTLKIFSIVHAKDLLMPHTKLQVCTLKINTIFCHRKKNPITFEQECSIVPDAIEMSCPLLRMGVSFAWTPTTTKYCEDVIYS